MADRYRRGHVRGTGPGRRPGGRSVSVAAGRVLRALRSIAAVSGADGAALLLTAGGRLSVVAGTTAAGAGLPYAPQFERYWRAYESARGAAVTELPVPITDIAAAGAGVGGTPRPAAPVRAVLSVPIAGHTGGALNLYHHTPHEWSPGELAAGAQLAAAMGTLLDLLAAHPPARGAQFQVSP